MDGLTGMRQQFRLLFTEICTEDLLGQGRRDHSTLSAVFDENDYGDFGIISVAKTYEPGMIRQRFSRLLSVLVSNHLCRPGFAADVLAGNGSIVSRSPVINALPHSLSDSSGIFIAHRYTANGPFLLI